MTTRNQTISEIGNLYRSVLFECQQISPKDFDHAISLFENTAQELQIPGLSFAAKRMKHFRSSGISSINIGGTMGSGKSSLGERIANELGFQFRDSDSFHSDANKSKMAKGHPLNDNDRFSFLKGVQEYLRHRSCLSTCSALTDLYRAILAGQDASCLKTPTHLAHTSPWSIEQPNYGLLQVMIIKPYEQALDELDHANSGGAPRMLDNEQHFITVTRKSEEDAIQSGKTPLLRNQYDLFNAHPPMPWDALLLESETFRTDNGYELEILLEDVRKLPFSGSSVS